MPQDAFNLSRLVRELNACFKGGKINRIVAPNNDEIVLIVYTGKRTEKLYISVNPGSARIGIIDVERENPLTASNFCMLLRKHLLSATIDEISLCKFDRIVKIDLTASDEFFDAKKKVLFVELMGRYSNVILTEDGKVLGGNRGINSFDNGVRPLIVNRAYTFPPSNSKLEPKDRALIEKFKEENELELKDKIFNFVQGISMQTATEIAYRFNEKYGEYITEKAPQLFDYINEFLFENPTRPCVYFNDGLVKDSCAFAYKTYQGEIRYFDTLIEAEKFYFSEREKAKNFTALKQRLTGILDAQIKKNKKKLNAILTREKDALSAESDKLFGELILANIYKIKSGDESLEAVNYYDNSLVKIVLDKTLSPSVNAERYYKKYNKKKRALVALTPQKESAKNELDYLTKVCDFIALSEEVDDLISIKKELENEGLISVQKSTRKKEQEVRLKEYLIDGFTVKVGRNNYENEKVTFTAKGDYVWLHAKDYSSSHCVIEEALEKVPQSVIVKAGEICAYYSKGREAGKVEIVYTKKMNVKKPPKAKTGSVIYNGYNSMIVLPKNHTEFLKNNAKP